MSMLLVEMESWKSTVSSCKHRFYRTGQISLANWIFPGRRRQSFLLKSRFVFVSGDI